MTSNEPLKDKAEPLYAMPQAALPNLDAIADSALSAMSQGLSKTDLLKWLEDVQQSTMSAVQAQHSWQPIETAPLDCDVDLFGFIAYDLLEMRLTDCEFKDGTWYYFQDGKMWPISQLSFTPTHWRPITVPDLGNNHVSMALPS